MILLNFSHPLTAAQADQLAALAGEPLERTVDLPVQFDPGAPFEPQLRALAAAIPLSPAELQTLPLLVNPPALNFITAVLLAHLHGLMGYFPPVIRLRPAAGSMPNRFEVAEILNLQAVREAARTSRFE